MNERAPIPEVLTQPEPGPVLVIAPHADDDVLGCGGTACLHADAGDRVHTIIVFDGAAGDADDRHDPEQYRLTRQREAREAGRHLGIHEYEFWGYPEGHMPADPELATAARRLAERVREIAPSTVYAPWIGESHLDHHVLARVVRMALHDYSFEGQAWGYEVWTPLIATRVVDITPVQERKLQAIRLHVSQLEHHDLVHKGLAVSAQRAMYLDYASTHGEAFLPLGEPAPEDVALLKEYL